MLELFINEYGYDLSSTIHNDNPDQFGLNKQEILNMFENARDRIMSDRSIDALIISYSGHGGESVLYAADYDEDKDKDNKECGKIGIVDIQNLFTDYQFWSMPKIMIADACRGNKGDNKRVDKRNHIDTTKGNWQFIYANPETYTSDNNGKDGGFVIKCISFVLKKDDCKDSKLTLETKKIF